MWLVQGVAVIAGLGSEHDTTVSPLGSTGGTLTGTTGTLLLPGLTAATGNLCTSQSGLCALTAICQVILHDIVNNSLIGLDTENSLGEFDLADLLAGHIINISLRHDLRSSP